MTPEISRIVATVSNTMGLVPGPVMDELIKVAEKAKTVEDLPVWAQGVWNVQKGKAA